MRRGDRSNPVLEVLHTSASRDASEESDRAITAIPPYFGCLDSDRDSVGADRLHEPSARFLGDIGLFDACSDRWTQESV